MYFKLKNKILSVCTIQCHACCSVNAFFKRLGQKLNFVLAYLFDSISQKVLFYRLTSDIFYKKMSEWSHNVLKEYKNDMKHIKLVIEIE